MSFLRCLIDGVPWDVFPPGVGMSWWSAEQISRSLDLARTKFTASQDPTTRQGMSLISTGRWWSTTGSPSCFQCNHPDHQRLLDLNRPRARELVQATHPLACLLPSRSPHRQGRRLSPRSWSERRTPWKRSAQFAVGIDMGAGCRQGAGPSDPPPRVFAAEPKPAPTGAKTPSAGAGPSGAPPRVFAAEPKPAPTGAPAVAKTPSAEAGPSDPPPRVFAAEPQPASTGAKTPSAGAGPSGAPPRVFAAEPQPASTGAK
eukprot:jgi/Tetstr1/454909/TSEL_041773.t1